MKQNFRTNYLNSLGVNDHSQLNRESTPLESLLGEDSIDLVKLHKIVEKYDIPSKYRADVWKLLLGVTPEHKDAREFVKQEKQKQYEDLKSVSLSALRKALDPLLMKAISEASLLRSQNTTQQSFSLKRRQSLDVSRLFNYSGNSNSTSVNPHNHANNSEFAPQSYHNGTSLYRRSSVELPPSLSDSNNQYVDSLISNAPMMAQPSHSKPSLSSWSPSIVHIVRVYCVQQQYLLGNPIDKEATIIDLLKMAEMLFSVLGDESESFWCLVSLLEENKFLQNVLQNANKRGGSATSIMMEAAERMMWSDPTMELLNTKYSFQGRSSITSRRLNELEKLLELMENSLYKHLQTTKVSVEHVAQRWIRSYFCNALPLMKATKIWDKIISLSPDFINFFIIALLQSYKSAILDQPDAKSIIELLSDLSDVKLDNVLKKAMDVMKTYRQMQSSKIKRSPSAASLANSSNLRRSRDATDMIVIRFVIHYHTEFGQVLAIAGSIPELGNWNPQQMKTLNWSEGNIWIAEVALKRNALPFEYKYNVYDTCAKRIVRWENLPNRRFDHAPPFSLVEIRDNWDIYINSMNINTSFSSPVAMIST